MHYLVFDTETTGLPRDWKRPSTDTDNWPRIVQVAWATVDLSACSVSPVTSHIIRPDGFTIPEAASRVHGVTTERAMAEGVDIQVALNAFLEVLEDTRVLVAHNVSFDRPVVGAEFVRLRGQDPLREVSTLCTKQASTDYCRLPGRYGWKWPTLQELHWTLFGHGFIGAHDAGLDVTACAQCFVELVHRGIVAVPSPAGAVQT